MRNAPNFTTPYQSNNKINNMQRKVVYLLLAAVVAFTACQPGGDPKKVAKAFYQALDDKDYEKAKSLATYDSRTALDLLKTTESVGQSLVGKDNTEKKKKKADNIEWGEVEMRGEIAVVKMKVNNENRNIRLKKENGEWKVALDKDNLKKAGIERGIDEAGGISDKAIKKAMKGVDKINKDSLTKALQKAGEALKKAEDALNELKEQ